MNIQWQMAKGLIILPSLLFKALENQSLTPSGKGRFKEWPYILK